ncbi:MAG: amino acid permease, partial [Armatimonadia bacterium]|nr:amino acid permease [Armatimonadia bacterium]
MAEGLMSDEARNNIRPDHDEVELTRDMTLFQILMIGVGAMIGAGIFVLTGTASGEAGPAVLVAFLLNGLIAFMTGSIYAELGAMMPAAGGGYVWIHRSVGGLPGFLAGWISWFGHSVACSLYAVAFAHYTAAALAGPHEPVLGMPPEVFSKVAAVFSIALFGYINFRGASETGKAEAVVTIGKLIVLGLFVLSGFLVLKDRPHWQQQFQPFAPNGLTGIFGAMGVIFIAFQGYEIVAQSGEEVVNPKRNVPKAILWSVGVVLVVYLLVAFVSIAAVTGPEGTPSWRYLDSLKELGIVEAARQFMIGGPVFGRLLLLIGGLFSTASALNATIYSSSRVAYAMSRDANLPDSLSAIHPATRTPHVALVVSLVIIAAMAILLPLETVASAADIMFLLLFVAIAGVALVLRKRRPDADRAFKAPWFPVLPIVAVLCQFGLAAHLFSFSPISWLVSGGWLVAGGIIFFTYSRRRQLARAHTPVA